MKQHCTCENTTRPSKEILETTLQRINISHLGKRKIIFKMPFLGDMLVPWRVIIWNFSLKIPTFTALFFSQMNDVFFPLGSFDIVDDQWTVEPTLLGTQRSLLQFGTFEDDLDTLLPSSVEVHPFPEKTFNPKDLGPSNGRVKEPV